MCVTAHALHTNAADGVPACRLDLRDIRVVTKLGGTVDDSEMVEGMVFDQKAAKAAGGPTRVENAKVALVQFHISPPKTDIENNVIISDYAQVRVDLLTYHQWRPAAWVPSRTKSSAFPDGTTP
jgi:chaperonin GroEL (HSP60 family)